MEKEQMSTPLPAMAVKIPPTNPVNSKTIICQGPKFWIESKVLRFFSLFGANKICNQTDC